MKLAPIWLVPTLGGAVIAGTTAAVILLTARHDRAPAPTATTQRWCPPTIEDRLLTRSIYRGADRDESVLACYYAAPKVKL